MLQTPPKIRTQFDTMLIEKNIPKSAHNDYRKWLRYYLDFCLKYHFDNSRKESLPYFIKKIRDKRQTTGQQKQAHQAISVYYEVVKELSKTTEKISSDKQPFSQHDDLQIKNADWRSVYEKLNAEIKIRHYSPRTLRSYRGWARQLQGFTRSKDPRLLAAVDVKDFLTFLAVKRKVSAASQNQAFNALLFFFRHVLKKDFREIKDIPRAKRKPHIPVVLSREEIDAIVSALFHPYNLIVKMLYGCGLRLSECMSLRVQSFNLDHLVLTCAWHDAFAELLAESWK